MKSNLKLNTFASLGAAALLLLGAGSLSAQDRGPGNFDPEQMRQRMMDMMRERFDVKDDGEWKVISERLTKVTEARMATMNFGRPGGGGPGGPGGRGGGPGGPGGGDRPQGERPQGGPDGNAQGRPPGGGGPGGPGGFGGFNRPSDPDMEALQKAIDAKASADEIKGLLAKVRASRQAKQAQLEKAQADLREVLSVRQEAIAVTIGMLN